MGQDLRVVVPNASNFLRVTSTNRPFSVRGLNKLVQIVTKAILTSPGQDIFSPGYGAGLREALPNRAHQATEAGAITDLTIAILRVESDIKRFQQEEGNTINERLQSLTLLDAAFDQANLVWDVVLDVVSEGGQAAQVPIVIELAGQ